MVFDQLSWAADHRDAEAREGEASPFEVRVLDGVNWCFESGSFSFGHVPVCAEEMLISGLPAWLLVGARDMERASWDGRGLTSWHPYLWLNYCQALHQGCIEECR